MNLSFFDIEEVDVVSGGMEDGEKEYGVCELLVYLQVFIEWQEMQFGMNDMYDCVVDWQQNQYVVNIEDEISIMRDLDGVFECVEIGEMSVGCLFLFILSQYVSEIEFVRQYIICR